MRATLEIYLQMNISENAFVAVIKIELNGFLMANPLHYTKINNLESKCRSDGACIQNS